MDIEKQDLVAGVDWDWKESVADYPASTHTLKYYLKKSTGDTITLTSTADGDSHEFEIDKATTAGYAAGWYRYQAIVVNDSDANDVHEVEEPGYVRVYPDLTTVSDAREHAHKMVDYLRAVQLEMAQQQYESLSIEGRSIVQKKMEDIRKELQYWERKAKVKKRVRQLIQFD